MRIKRALQIGIASTMLLVGGVFTSVQLPTAAPDSGGAVSAKVSASKATTNKKAKKYLKQDKETKSYIKSVSMVNDVMTVHLKDIRTFDGGFGAVYVRRLASITGDAAKTPLAKNGVALVQRSEYMDSTGNKKDLMDFATYYSRSKLDGIDFNNYPKLVQHTPKTMLDNADGYYLQKDFVSNSKSSFKGMDLMKIDDNSLMADFMDKFGA